MSTSMRQLWTGIQITNANSVTFNGTRRVIQNYIFILVAFICISTLTGNAHGQFCFDVGSSEDQTCLSTAFATCKSSTTVCSPLPPTGLVGECIYQGPDLIDGETCGYTNVTNECVPMGVCFDGQCQIDRIENPLGNDDSDEDNNCCLLSSDCSDNDPCTQNRCKFFNDDDDDDYSDDYHCKESYLAGQPCTTNRFCFENGACLLSSTNDNCNDNTALDCCEEEFISLCCAIDQFNDKTGSNSVCTDNQNNECVIDFCDTEDTHQCATKEVICDDDNECTDEDCIKEIGCVYDILTPEGNLCNDENACSSNDICLSGTCLGDPIVDCCLFDSDCEQIDVCMNGQICSNNVCVGGTPISNCCETLDDCDDNDECTVELKCSFNVCIRGPLDCLQGNTCLDVTCDTVTGCGTPTMLTNGTLCNIGNVCFLDQTCLSGECQGGTTVAHCCNDNNECDDANGCTVDGCDIFDNICIFDPTPLNSMACSQEDDDNNICTINSCEGGQCIISKTVDGCCETDDMCEDDDVCTTNGCFNNECRVLNVEGCCNVVDDCDDNLACTLDACDTMNNTCTNVYITDCCENDTDCDDGNICTDDMCLDNDSMCVNIQIENCCVQDTDCDDASVCTVEACNESTNTCTYIDAFNCNDDNVCTEDSCDAIAGCVNNAEPNIDLPCGPISICSSLPHCKFDGTCVPDIILDPNDICDDNNTCTQEFCDFDIGCINDAIPNNGQPCDDANVCTERELCTNGLCTGSIIENCCNITDVCDDNDACTIDTCDQSSGCLYIELSCNDNNQCTVDTCTGDNGIGCINDAIIAEGLVCDDGRNDTRDDVCDTEGRCAGTRIIDQDAESRKYGYAILVVFITVPIVIACCWLCIKISYYRQGPPQSYQILPTVTEEELRSVMNNPVLQSNVMTRPLPQLSSIRTAQIPQLSSSIGVNSVDNNKTATNASIRQRRTLTDVDLII